MNSNVTDRPLQKTVAVLASLRFVGDSVDPSVVTAKLDIAPTKTRLASPTGVTNDKQHHRNGAWVLDSDLSKTTSVEQHIGRLLDRVEGKAQKIRWLSLHGFS